MNLKFNHSVAAIILALSFSAPGIAGPIEDGVAAYERGDYATALQLFRPSAEGGDAIAQFNLGIMYNNGFGVPQDNATALKWFGLAAAQGDRTSAEYRDVVARRITPVKQTGALTTGEAAYESGDYATALRIFRASADKGEARAQSNLGVMYHNGHGVPKDFVRAYMWFSLAAAQSDETAIEYRDYVKQSMSPAQIVEAQKLARKLVPKARKGSPPKKITAAQPE
jgi:TPR repeat protein